MTDPIRPPTNEVAHDGPLAERAGLPSKRHLPATGRRAGMPSLRRRFPQSPHRASLFANDGFRTFWMLRLLAQTGQGALLYGLLVVLVDRTDSSFYNSLFVVCAIVPTVLFGLPAGIVVDSLPYRPLLATLNVIRFVFVLALIAEPPSLTGIFAATLGVWTIHQFYSPAESSTLADLLPRYRYTTAQALSNLASSIAQLLGFVIFAPLLLKLSGPRALFVFCALVFVGATLAAIRLPSLDAAQRKRRAAERAASRQSIREMLLTGWRYIQQERTVYDAIVGDILVGIGLSGLVVIMPLYLKGVLNTSAENTVFVFAPSAAGLLLGLRAAPQLVRLVGARPIAIGGLLLFALCIGLLGFVVTVEQFLNDRLGLPIERMADTLRIQPLILTVMLISVPAGFASSVVNVVSRSSVLAHTPPNRRGQVVATQNLIQNVGALAPTLLAGLLADLIGVERVAIAIAMLMTGGAALALTLNKSTAARAAPA